MASEPYTPHPHLGRTCTKHDEILYTKYSTYSLKALTRSPKRQKAYTFHQETRRLPASTRATPRTCAANTRRTTARAPIRFRCTAGTATADEPVIDLRASHDRRLALAMDHCLHCEVGRRQTGAAGCVDRNRWATEVEVVRHPVRDHRRPRCERPAGLVIILRVRVEVTQRVQHERRSVKRIMSDPNNQPVSQCALLRQVR